MNKRKILIGTGVVFVIAIALVAVFLIFNNKPIKLEMSEWCYDTVIRISDSYYLAKEGDECFFVYKDGNIVNSLKDEEGNKVPEKFESYKTDLQEGSVAIIWTEDEKSKTLLLDRNLESIKSFSDITLEDYRYDIVEYKTSDNRYKILNLAGNGYSSTGKYYIGSEYIKGSGSKFYKYSVNDSNLVLGESKSYKVDDMDVSAWSGAVSKDGWIVCNLKADGENKKVGFYNIKTSEFVEMDNEITSCRNFYGTDGSNNVSVLNNVAVIRVSKENDGIYRAYSLEKKEYISDEYLGIYRYEDRDAPCLVKYKDEKWGFVDKDTFKPISDKFDDASSFCNGVAMITNNGETYLINKKFKKVSESLTGIKAAHCVTDSYFYANLGNQAVFMAKDENDKYHLITVDVSKVK